MPFDKVSRPPAARISKVKVVFEKHIPRNEDGTDGVAKYFASFELQTESADGSPNRSIEGELLQHMTNAQKAGQKDFIDAMHIKANAEAL